MKGYVDHSIAAADLRVMIVDDASDYREAVALTLLRLGISDISEAVSGEEALSWLAKVSPAVVIMDFQLPGMHGVETARRMKQQRPDLVIVLVSAYPKEAFAEAAREGKIDAVIPKVFVGPDQIGHILNEWGILPSPLGAT